MLTQGDFLNGRLRKGPLNTAPTPKAELKLATVEWPDLAPLLDKICVRPIDPPKSSAGGIVLSEKTVSAEIALTTVGQVISIGSLCFQALTKDGLDYKRELSKPVVGSWVLYRKHAGQPVFVRQNGDGQKLDKNSAPRLLLMTEEDLLAVFADEKEARKVWAWCG